MTTAIDYNWSTNGAGTAFSNPFNPVPDASVLLDASAQPADPWFETAHFMGAFNPNGENWLEGWTYADDSGAIEEEVATCDCHRWATETRSSSPMQLETEPERPHGRVTIRTY